MELTAMDVKCPQCGNVFPVRSQLEEKFREQFEKERSELRKKYLEEKSKLEQEKNRIELEKQELREKLIRELDEKNQKTIENIRKQLQQQSELETQHLKKMLEDQNEKLKQYKQYELELMKMKDKMNEMQQDFALRLEKEKLEWKKQAENELRGKIQEAYEIKMKEYELKLEQQNKLINELKQKSEQGSMQLQGEAMEVALQEILMQNFPQDRIEEVPKGCRGADCIQRVINHTGNECGIIVFECKKTKNFHQDWIEKLKEDQRAINADVAVLVTDVFPKDLSQFGFYQGVWVCHLREVIPLTLVLRDKILRVWEVMKTQENKGEKMTMLYNYLTGNEFRQQIQAIAEAFMNMKEQINKERAYMEKSWKEREMQLNKILLNTSHMYGSVRAIAGKNIEPVKYLDSAD